MLLPVVSIIGMREFIGGRRQLVLLVALFVVNYLLCSLTANFHFNININSGL